MDTHLVVVLDRSGSMVDMKSDMEKGFDQYISDQQKLPDPMYVTLVQFDTVSTDIVYSRLPLAQVPKLQFLPRGGTPLLDAVGKAITTVDEKPGEQTLVLVLTDGQENSSIEWTKTNLKLLVADKIKAGWGFLYFGANVDAFSEAGAFMGAAAAASNSARFTSSPKGVETMYSVVSNTSAKYRSTGDSTIDLADKKLLDDLTNEEK